jgi:hypothetical protein
MRDVVLHGGPFEAFDRSVGFARQLAESFGARLHIVYTVSDPLSAGWTSEMGAEGLPAVHQAIEDEARGRLSRAMPPEVQERLDVQLVIRIGPAAQEVVRYTQDHPVDLAIVHAPVDDPDKTLARDLVDSGRCAVLVLR